MKAIHFLFPLITGLLLHPAAHAALTVICQSESDHDLELKEYPLHFEPYEANEFRARVNVKSKLFPAMTAKLAVYERLNGDTVKWYSQIAVVDDKDYVVGRGTDRVEFSNSSGENIQLVCEAFDKTEQLTLPPQPADKRVRLRLKAAGGPAAVREYDSGQVDDEGQAISTELNKADIYDIIRHLSAQNFDQAQLLTATLKTLADGGAQPRFLEYNNGEDYGFNGHVGNVQKNQKCQGEDGEFACDIEHFTLEGGISGAFKDHPWRNDNVGFVFLKIEGTILRESKSRLIRVYNITSLRLERPEGLGSGGGSTSGGRITGGQ